MKNSQHVVKHDDGWAVRKSKSDKVTKTFKTQADAIEYGRQVAINQETELFIHRPNGQIRDRNSYGNDPESSKG
jgi:hypothetical protein